MSRLLDDGTYQRVALALRVVEWARHELDREYRETTARNDGPPAIRFAGGRTEPWCGHMVACCFRECGAPIPGDVVPSLTRANPLARVETLERVFKRHGWFYAAAEPGDVLLLLARDGSDDGDGRHCGIVERVTATHVISIEGNYGNRMQRVERLLTHKLISGYGRRPEIERMH